MATNYGPEIGKSYNSKLREVYQKLLGLPQKNPIAFEISRAIKSTESKLVEVGSQVDTIMGKFLLRNEAGDYIVKSETLKMIENAAREGLHLSPTEKGFIVDGDKESEKNYFRELDELLEQVTILDVIRVDIQEKTIRVDGQSFKLIDLLSEYFEVGQINFLEEIGILSNL